MNIVGIDIGGTKSTVICGQVNKDGPPQVLGRKVLKTGDYPDPYRMISRMQDELEDLLVDLAIEPNKVSAIGISCGGPLDSDKGIILSPPNLPGWDEIPIVRLFEEKYATKAYIQNDANACALAEWKFGAGRGTKNMIFLTFGTGLGSGLILNGMLYSGTNDNAGEIGHIRLSEFGPVGYGKSGSFEGFCSGGGIAQLARMKAMERFQMGKSVGFCKSLHELNSITAQSVAHAAEKGDDLAMEIYRISGSYLGKGLSVIIDILNPELIVIGSIYQRSGFLLEESMQQAIEREALPLSRKTCRVVPAELGDKIGDYASLSVASYNLINKSLTT